MKSVEVMSPMSILGGKGNDQNLCTPLSSEKGDACVATQGMESNFVKGHSLVSNNEKGRNRVKLSTWLLQVGKINTCTVYDPGEKGGSFRVCPWFKVPGALS